MTRAAKTGRAPTLPTSEGQSPQDGPSEGESSLRRGLALRSWARLPRHHHESAVTARFATHLDGLGPTEADRVHAFLKGLDSHCTLPQDEKEAIADDFRAAILYYAGTGVPLDDGLNRLNMENLGGFYARRAIGWYRLDDAAKIYPLSMKHGHMEVFRLSVRFTHEVVPELLQLALTFTIKRFPTFATTVKKGVFWHYLDAAKRRYSIQPEVDAPCKPLKVSGSNSQSFRVLYWRNRVSVEYFHILTDGFGGLVFLKTLAHEYLRLVVGTAGVEPSESDAGGAESAGVLPVAAYAGRDLSILDVNALPSVEEAANEFPRADKTDNTSGFMDRMAVQMSGRLTHTKPCRVLHFRMSAGALKAAAKARGATITAYLLALMFVAGRYATDETEGEISIQVPVDMRKFYPSTTVRNFSMYCGIRLPLREITDVESIVAPLSAQLTQKASKAAMSEMLNSTLSIVRKTWWIPLFIKAPIIRIVYGFLGDKIFTNTLSNLQVVPFPPDMAAHIEAMDFVVGSAQTNRAACAMVTVGDAAMLSITKMTADPSFEERIHTLLAQDGVDTRVEGSELHAY